MRSNDPVRVSVLSPQPIIEAGVSALLGRHPDRVELLPPPVTRNVLAHMAPAADDDQEVEAEVVLYDAVGLLDPDAKDLEHLVDRTTSHVLVISHDLRPDLTSRALQRGAHGYFSLTVGADELVAAVESAATGWVVGDPGTDPTVGSGVSAANMLRTGNDVDLTPREASTLAYIAQGLSNHEIAAREFISINSVKTYIRSAYQKIGVTSRSQAVSWAIQNGLDPDPTHAPDQPGNLRR